MRSSRTYLLSLLLVLPVFAFILHHYLAHAPQLQPTGFTVDENVLYMSYARQYVDDQYQFAGYSNPFDADPDSPHIYFQPATWILSLFLWAGADPGLTFTLFGLLAAYACVFMGIKIIRLLVPADQSIGIPSLLFTWGGGLTVLAGVAYAITSGQQMGFDSIYLADPARGWWGLNWGRNLFIPLEAYYHFLFLLNIYWLIRRDWKLSIAGAVLLSISHPFTGIEYLLIVAGWVLMEKLIFRNGLIPRWYLPAIVAVILLHCGYYLYFLNQYESHRQLFSQYSAGWTYSLLTAGAAYILVLVLALLQQRFRKQPVEDHSFQRLFLAWALISFLLSKHEWFLPAMQPIHFTRGYTWAGLFLFSLPFISWFIQWCRTRGRRWLIIVFIGVLLFDNAVWLTGILKDNYKQEWEGHISKETGEVITFLEKNAAKEDLLISPNTLIPYLANAYSSINSWVTHPYNTPQWQMRYDQMMEYFSTGNMPEKWAGRRLWVLVDATNKDLADVGGRRVFRNGRYSIFIH